MTRKTKRQTGLKGKARLRAELVELTRDMHRAGLVDDTEPEQTTIKMLGRDALPKVKPLSPTEIAKLRERAGVSQAVMAGYLNVAVSTVSQWERGERRPTSTALKLLHVVKDKGLDTLR